MLDDLFGRPAAPPGPPAVLFVCTGNICRSPLAEKLFRARLAERPWSSITTSSAGLHAVVGASMEPEPLAITLRHHGDPAHSATQLTAQAARSASLILTMTREQRSELSQEYPFALKRTFTLVEFTRLLGEVGDRVKPPVPGSDEVLFDTVMEASRFRGMVVARPEDDIEDPYRRSLETHERVGERIAALVATLAGQLAPDTRQALR